jgi:hypothetical protein
MRQLRAQMEALPDGPQFTQMRAGLESDYYDLENIERGYSQIAGIKAEATYADDGLIYGSYGISKTIGIIMFSQLVLFKSKFMMEAKDDSKKKDELEQLTR